MVRPLLAFAAAAVRSAAIISPAAEASGTARVVGPPGRALLIPALVQLRLACLAFAALAVVFFSFPAVASAISVEAAESGLSAAVYTRKAPSYGFDVYQGSCRRITQSRFSCRFKAVQVDRRWIGRGTLRYIGNNYFRYNLRGRVEDCGPYGCRKVKGFSWKGRTPWG